MSTQDDDASKGSTSYQFFSQDSYTNYFVDQISNTAGSDSSASTSSFSYTPTLTFPPTAAPDVASEANSTASGAIESITNDKVNTYAGMLFGPDLSPDVVQVESSIMMASAAPQVASSVALPAQKQAHAPAPAPYSATAAPSPAPVVATPVVQEPAKPNLLQDIEPEPTFEERVAAMKHAEAIQAMKEQKSAPPPAKIIVSANQLDAIPAMQSTPADDGWRQFPQPQSIASSAADTFSAEFNFNRSLLKIFWRIDVDHNNRVSKKELAQALSENWFDGDDRVLAKILYDSYEDISPEAIFCDAGLSVNNILSYAPFADLANISMAWDCEDEKPVVTKASNDRAKKPSTQSLRSLFNKR